MIVFKGILAGLVCAAVMIVVALFYLAYSASNDELAWRERCDDNDDPS